MDLYGKLLTTIVEYSQRAGLRHYYDTITHDHSDQHTALASIIGHQGEKWPIRISQWSSDDVLRWEIARLLLHIAQTRETVDAIERESVEGAYRQDSDGRCALGTDFTRYLVARYMQNDQFSIKRSAGTIPRWNVSYRSLDYLLTSDEVIIQSVLPESVMHRLPRPLTQSEKSLQEQAMARGATWQPKDQRNIVELNKIIELPPSGNAIINDALRYIYIHSAETNHRQTILRISSTATRPANPEGDSLTWWRYSAYHATAQMTHTKEPEEIGEAWRHHVAAIQAKEATAN